METGRDRQPWIILVPCWPEDLNAESMDGDGYVYAEEDMKRNNSFAKGVLPRDRDRSDLFATSITLQSSTQTIRESVGFYL